MKFQLEARYCALLLVFVSFGTVATQEVGEACLGCICQAASNCNTTISCKGDVCGLFKITWPFWADSGKPVILNDDPNSEGAYQRCTLDAYCASEAVRGYMRKYAQDCNQDGVIDCADYARIHNLGGYGCTGNPKPEFLDQFNSCLNDLRVTGIVQI